MSELDTVLTADTADYERAMERSAGAVDKVTDAQDKYNDVEATGISLKAEDSLKSIQMATVYGTVIMAMGEMASSAGQINAQLQALGLSNGELTDGQKSFQAWTSYATNMTMPVMRGIQVEAQLVGTKFEGMGMALGGVMTAMDAINLTAAAFNAQTEEQRRTLSLLAGVTWAMTAAQLAYGAVKAFASNPTPAGIAAAVAGTAIVGGLIAGVGTYVAAGQASTPRAQTWGDGAKVVKESGPVYLDKGERISRSNSVTINMGGTNMSASDIRRAVAQGLRDDARSRGVHRSG